MPAGALPKVATPTGPGGNLAQFLSTPDFEDETQMIEWLILVESRIQPQQITVGDFRQLRRQQREIQVHATEIYLLNPLRYMHHAYIQCTENLD